MLEDKTEDTRSIAGVHPLLLLPLATVTLAAGVVVFRWRFPCTTVDALVKEGASVQELLTKAWKENLLGELEGEFTQTWRRYNEDIENIKLDSTQAPDSRTHPTAWIGFQWRQLRAIDVCYTGLQNLSASITLKTETEKRNRRYFIPVDASSSGIYTPSTAGSFQIPANLGSAE
ncbi:hypothetical protein Moror_3649 [Moniliophthora roreri MCA 2997]|uniref:Uncharacterized protein n=2 Tax=Moniliophthora roreri TaxID=221103 RepID=V2Y0A2_MONRO|nr:hypothetical protein Moror_3649 [Moniliophthora roreri MCA 2997]KAI3602116.1 hypothetical protein WG66_000313 [Moniliophthora roreri]